MILRMDAWNLQEEIETISEITYKEQQLMLWANYIIWANHML